MRIVIVKDKITLGELKEIAREFYVDMIKGAVDIEKEIVAFGGEYHIDASTVLTDAGSKQENIWGFNVVFGRQKEQRLEYTALINIRPAVNNRGMFIESEDVRNKIKKIVDARIT